MNAPSVPSWERPTVDLAPAQTKDDEPVTVVPLASSRMERALARAAGAALDPAHFAALQARIPLFEAACRRAGLDSKNPRLLAAFFDLSNQCGARVWNRFLNRLPQTLTRKPPSLKDVVHARFDALFDDRGRFMAGALTHAAAAIADQLKRQNALEAVLSSA